MHKHILRHLKTIPAVTDILGADPMKIFPHDKSDELEDSGGNVVRIKPPYVLMPWAGGDSIESLDGPCGTIEFYLNVVGVANLGSQAEEALLAIRSAIGHVAYEQWDGITIQQTRMSLPSDNSLAPSSGTNSTLKQMSSSLFIRADYNP